MPSTPSPATGNLTVRSDRLTLILRASPTRIVVDGLTDIARGHQWFAAGAPLARYRVIGGDGLMVDANTAGEITGLTAAQRDDGVDASFSDAVVPLHVRLRIDRDLDGSLRFGGAVRSDADEPVSVEIAFPWFIEPAPSPDVQAMAPIEAGTVRPLADGQVTNGGFFEHGTFACAGSVFPVAHVGSPEQGSGVVVHGSELGDATRVFESGPAGCGCRWTVLLQPGEETELAESIVDVTDGRWQQAVASYRDRVPDPQFVETPTWLRAAGAIYNPLAEGGGGIYQTEPTVGLADRIDCFTELPRFLDEARSMGTDVLHLFDYWEKSRADGRPDYWHKGDYVPRRDLGGERALTAGIDAVHERGGRVLLYVEPFILYGATDLGLARGEDWAARDLWHGDLIDTYPDNYSMPPWHREWRQHVVDTAVRLTERTGADGIFLDSFGWQWNWLGTTRSEPGGHDATAWNQGILDLANEVRAAIRTVRPDAVVLTEALTLPLATAVDGGLDASFAWNIELNQPGPLRSPVRHGFPAVNFFTNGRTIEQLREIFATGLNLALSHRWLDHAEEIEQLVRLRTLYADALVDGRVTEIADSGDGLLANLFVGERERVLVALNRSAESQRFALPETGTGEWQEVYPLCNFTSSERFRMLAPYELIAWRESGGR